MSIKAQTVYRGLAVFGFILFFGTTILQARAIQELPNLDPILIVPLYSTAGVSVPVGASSTDPPNTGAKAEQQADVLTTSTPRTTRTPLTTRIRQRLTSSFLQLPVMSSLNYRYSAHSIREQFSTTISPLNLCELVQDTQQLSKVARGFPRAKLLYSAVLLGSIQHRIECPNIDAFGEARMAIAAAVALAPHDTAILYYAGVQLLWLDRDRGLTLLQKSAEGNPVFSDDQKTFLYGLPQNQHELELLMPRSLLAAQEWSSHFIQARPKEYRLWYPAFQQRWKEVLSEQNSAEDLEQLRALYHADSVRYDDTIRQALDSRVSKLFHRSNPALSRLLAERAGMVRVPVVKSFLMQDVLPHRAQLSNWLLDTDTGAIRLERANVSLGMYLPEGFEPQLLIVRNRLNRWQPRPGDLALWVSTDNHRYATIAMVHPPESIRDGREELIILKLPKSNARFLKVRYTHQGIPGVLQNSAADIVSLYGVRRQEKRP